MGCNCKSTIARVASGAIGLTKALVGAGYVDSATLIHRRRTCRECPQNSGGICADCGCIIVAKTTQVSEKCERWKLI